jgi:hypothetical protein
MTRVRFCLFEIALQAIGKWGEISFCNNSDDSLELPDPRNLDPTALPLSADARIRNLKVMAEFRFFQVSQFSEEQCSRPGSAGFGISPPLSICAISGWRRSDYSISSGVVEMRD